MPDRRLQPYLHWDGGVARGKGVEVDVIAR